ncbi:MAG: hypothetical protein NXH86_02730 [Flavobacteriaceae bacterium]|nr:hypothetical protein [Flavobacteriaceae bacterium]
MIDQFKIDLKAHFPHDLVDALISSYVEIKTNYIINKWEPSELNGGKFVEATIRLMQYACTGNYTPIGTSIRNMFNEIRQLEQSPSTILDSYRLNIPRCLGAIYNIRNRRGVGHLGGDVNPNKADAQLIITLSEWVLSELYRINYGVTLDKAQALVDALVSRKLELVFEINGMKRILNPKLSLKDKILLVLYSVEVPSISIDELLKHLKYKNKSYLQTKILTPLDEEQFIEMDENENLFILPPGINYVEANYENWKNKRK